MTRLQRKLIYLFFASVVTTLLLYWTWAPKLLIKDAKAKQRPRETSVVLPNVILRNFSQPQQVQINNQFPLSWNSSETRERSEPVTKNFTYSDYDVISSRYVTLHDDHGDYFVKGEGIRCLKEGTKSVTDKCVCAKGWHGISCSIPDIVEENRFKDPSKLRLRQGAPRRIIYGTTFNVEFEMLEIRMRDMGDLIDLILIVESNYTGFGDPKPLYLLERLKRGFLQEFQKKIAHIYLDHFPTGRNPKDGGYTDFYTKDYSGREGLKRIHGTRKDDIFITADADELHSREVLLFLKHHDGYPEPVGVYLRRNAFGFFWCSGLSLLGFACSLDMMETVYKNRAGELRGATSNQHKFVKQLDQYRTDSNNAVQMWNIGSPSNIAGWHCSWCFEPERVRIKLLSAYNYDFPRWGDYPNKTKLEFIRKLVTDGLWFDEKSTFKPMYMGRDAPYAPPYVLRNLEKFKRIIFNPYLPL